MENNRLSQDEIDALLNGTGSTLDEPEIPEVDEIGRAHV